MKALDHFPLFISQLFEAYEVTATLVYEVVKEWLDKNWQVLLNSSYIDDENEIIINIFEQSIREWKNRNIFISDMLEHILHEILSISPQKGKAVNDDVLKKAFLSTINTFLAFRIGYTIRVVLPLDVKIFERFNFPFLKSKNEIKLKNPIISRIMQLAFVDGSYHVDFENPDMIGVIGGCYLNNKVYLEEDVFASNKDTDKKFQTRTLSPDTELGISSIIYVPILDQNKNTGVLIGIYSLLKNIFSEEICQNPSILKKLQKSLKFIIPIQRFANAIETSVKHLLKNVVFDTATQIVERDVINEAASRTLTLIERGNEYNKNEKEILDNIFNSKFKNQLLSYIGHHGSTLLPFVRQIHEENLKKEHFDLISWWNEDVPKWAPQSLADLENYFSSSYDINSEHSIMVFGNRHALCEVFQAIVHNAVEHYRDKYPGPNERKPIINISIEGPNSELKYGLIIIKMPHATLFPTNEIDTLMLYTILRQGLPLVSGTRQGFGLFWSRCVLEAFNGRLQINQLRNNDMLTNYDYLKTIKDKKLNDNEINKLLIDYRFGLEFKICLMEAK